MARFLVGRAVGAVLTLLVMSFIIYGLMGLMPGDPLDLRIATDPHLSSADVARLKAQEGLDRPLPLRYLDWLRGTLSGEFGMSRDRRKPAEQVLARPLVNTLWLLGAAFLASVALALPLGVIAARMRHGPVDHAINLLCFAGISVPPFWLALMAILVFAVTLGWFPSGGVGPPGAPLTLGARLYHLALPAAVLTALSVGHYIRFMRASTLEQLRQDYIRTARAKGLGPWAVIRRHGLRNALIPVVTVIALSFGNLFSGALITEQIFAYRGMGKLIYDSIQLSDYNVAMLALMLATALVLVGNFLADLAYAALDPRVSYTAQGRREAGP